MIRRLRSLLLVLLAAGLGAVAGRVALEVRHRIDAGEPPESVDLRRVTVRVQDLVPGLVAALRVRDVPWSWLHIPSWLAAFGVNFAVAAIGGDLSRLRSMVERSAMGMAGVDPWDDEPEAEWTPNWAPDASPEPPPAADSGTGFTSFDR